MQLKVERFLYSEKSTIGKMYIDGNFSYYTLEDKVRLDGIKIMNETAIPASMIPYRVTLDTKSSNTKLDGHLLPRVWNVPGFEGIRIHWGNYPKDTSGCILVGKTYSTDFIGGNSRDAVKELVSKIDAAIKKGESVSIAIFDRIPSELSGKTMMA